MSGGEAVYEFVCKVDDLELGTSQKFSVGKRSVLIARTKDDRIFASHPECTHSALELTGGRLRGCWISCPHHGAMYNLENGHSPSALAMGPLKVYQTKVDGGDVQVLIEDDDGNEKPHIVSFGHGF